MKELKMTEENLIIIPEINLNREGFPLTFNPIKIKRNDENEAKYRHLTVLILVVFVSEENKILTINKYHKNKLKYPEKDFPTICFDIPGGHCDYNAIPNKELKMGLISEETIKKQAYREFLEEVRFVDIEGNVKETDLKFVGFYPCDNSNNKELAALFMIETAFASKDIETFDNVGDVVCKLDNKAIEYSSLLTLWQARKENEIKYRFEDGLARIMEKEDWLKKIK